MADRKIEFDVGLKLDTLDDDVKEAKKRLDELKRKNKTAKDSEEKNAYYAEQRYRDSQDAQRHGNKKAYEKLAKDAERYGQKVLEAQDEQARLKPELEDATREYERLLAAQEKNAKATSKIDQFMGSIKKRITGLAKRVLFFSLIAKAFRSLVGYMGQVIKNNAEASQAIGRLKGAFETLAYPLINAVLPAVISIVNWVTKLLTAVTQIISKITGKGLRAMQNMAKSAKKNGSLASFDTINKLGGSNNGIQAIYDQAELTEEEMDKILLQALAIGAAFAMWKLPSFSFLKDFASGIGAILTKVASITGIIALIAAAIVLITKIGGTFEQLIGGLKQVFSGFMEFITGIIEGDTEMIFNGLKNMAKGIGNVFLAVIGGIVNVFVKALNFVIDKINKISFDVPEWLPFIGGKHIGGNISHIPEWTVPKLAQGAVIPPNREFLAVLGDQTSGTNIETPLETMLEAFRTAIAENGQSININFTGDGAALVEMLRPQISISNKRRGI